MDDADRAAMVEQHARDIAMSVRKPTMILPEVGECHNCRASVLCMADWELRHSRSRK